MTGSKDYNFHLRGKRNQRMRQIFRELTNAFEEVRRGADADAITSAGSAFESVLKAICALNCWQHDPDKDRCSRLLDVCRENGLFPPFLQVDS
jgi:hypothetical protein